MDEKTAQALAQAQLAQQQAAGVPAQPPKELHFLKALGHGVLAFAHIAFEGKDDEDEAEGSDRRESVEDRRTRIKKAFSKRTRKSGRDGDRTKGGGSCCFGRRR